ncbi:MAG: hypothetical protein GY940_23575, partial [bacterium]|nr:hypothetical protein [bacterium]
GILNFEFQRNVTRWAVIGLIVLLVMGAVFQQLGIENHQRGIEKQVQFMEIEQKLVDRLLNWMQYGAIGFRVLLERCPLVSLFYNNTAFDDLIGFIDTGVRLRLGESKIGANAFKRPTGSSLDYSWYFKHFGILLVMVWGFFTFRNREYILYLMNFASAKSVYLGVLLARIIIVAAVLGIMGVVSYVQFLVNGIVLSGTELVHLPVFLGVSIIVLALLLSISAVLGAVDSLVKGALITGSIWIVAVSLWPETLNVLFTRHAAGELSSIHQLEIRKMEPLMDFEGEVIKESSKYKTAPEKKESDKRMSEHYWENIFKDVESVDNEMIERTGRMVEKFHFWSSFNPISFLKSVNNEISSAGFNAYMELYKGCRDIRRGFLRRYIDMIFYKTYSKVEP